MVKRLAPALLTLLSGCSLIFSPSSHMQGDRDAGRDASRSDGGIDAGPTEEICDNDADDDQDGDTDCQDSECSALPACEGVEICSDGSDNDGDEAIDCDDSDCASEPSCLPEVCDDGDDNDADGDTDCADSDCAAELACQCFERDDGTLCELVGLEAICLSGACAESTCGDEFIDVLHGEECEDGNGDPLDGCEPGSCTFTCETSAECSDGEICNGDEACDAGSHVCLTGELALDGTPCGAGGSCNAGVCVGSTCGDGTIDTARGEVCDDGDTADGDGCPSDCSFIEPGYTCMTEPSICRTTCGDGILAGDELCDDGNTSSGDGCTSMCNGPEPGFSCSTMPPGATMCRTSCGDGIRAGFEGCDDGGLDSGDGCDPMCNPEAGWECTGAMPTTCRPECGDGRILGGEECDDANTRMSDGCDPSCRVESRFSCVGEPSICTCTARPGEVCCVDSTCGPGASCSTGVCVACGMAGSGCCPGSTCDPGLACSPSMRCVTCGGMDQLCCPGDECTAPLTCRGGGCAIECSPRAATTAIVISEFGTRGAGGAADEFFEIYNAGGREIDISGWEIRKYAASGTVSPCGTLPSGTALRAGQFFLIGWPLYVGPTADFVVACTSIADTGGSLEIRDAGGRRIDLVGWGSAMVVEGVPLSSMPLGSGASYERRALDCSTSGTMAPGGDDAALGNSYDSDDNSMDFVVQMTRDPQNTSSPLEP
jgi:cysteine-rich repeat protein